MNIKASLIVLKYLLTDRDYTCHFIKDFETRRDYGNFLSKRFPMFDLTCYGLGDYLEDLTSYQLLKLRCSLLYEFYSTIK